ncbi:MAG: LCP family protein [Streptococcus gallolyticus]|nr:LCP family protein [Streptococcus gallolyticus]
MANQKSNERPAVKNSGIIRKKKKIKSKRKKTTIIVIVCVVIAFVIALIGLLVYLANLLNPNYNNVDIDNSNNNGKTVFYNGHEYRLNENIIACPFIGYDRNDIGSAPNGANGQADSIFVLCIDKETGKTSVIGVPRDAYIDVSKFVGSSYKGVERMQACMAFSYGTDATSGAEHTTDMLSQLFYGMPMDYYVAMSLDGVEALVNELGGITLVAKSTIPGTDIVKGQETTLFGSKTLKYVRYRDIYTDKSALERQQRDIDFLQHFINEVMRQAKNQVGFLLDLYNVAKDCIVSNVGLDTVSALALKYMSASNPSINFTTLKVGDVQVIDGYEVNYLDKTNLYETTLNVFYNKVS